MRTTYVSGPMTRIPRFNYDAFDDISAQLRSSGYEVISPSDRDREVYPDIEQWDGFKEGDATQIQAQGFDLQAMLSWDLRKITEVDEMVLLPGWEDSSGATHERYVAEVCGKPIWLAHAVRFAGGFRWELEYDEEQIRVSGGDRKPEISATGDFSPAAGYWDAGTLEMSTGFSPAIAQQLTDEFKAAQKRTFDTGATRDVADHKADFEGFLSILAIRAFGRYMHKNRMMGDGSLRDSDNWQKGIPRDAYMKSLLRHVFDVWQLHRGYGVVDYAGEEVTLEDALCGVLFNAQGYLHETLDPFEIRRVA